MKSAARKKRGRSLFFDRPATLRGRRRRSKRLAAAFGSPQVSATTVKSKRRIGRLEESLARDDQVSGTTAFPHLEIVPQGVLIEHAYKGRPWDYIFEEMDRDADLIGLLGRLYEAVLSIPRRLVPADTSDGADEAMKMVREVLQGIPHWGQILRHLVKHVGDGISFVELNWTRHGGVLRPYEMRPRPMRSFAFLRDERQEAVLHVRRFGAPNNVVCPDPWKFLWPVRDLQFFPWGRGLKDFLYYFWKAKWYTLLDWQAYNEKWLRPILDVSFTPSKKQEKEAKEEDAETSETLSEAADHIFGDGTFVHPDTTKLDTLDLKMPGNQAFREFADVLARSMSRVILAEVNTAGMRPGTGSFASDSVAAKISSQKVSLVGHDLSSYLRDTLFTWLVQANLPGAPVPRMQLDLKSEEQVELYLKRLESALKHGADVSRSHAYETWGLPLSPEPGDVSFIARQGGVHA